MQAAILADQAVTADDCAMVPPQQMAAVTALDLSNQSIVSLKAGDFDGLAGVTALDLRDNPGLSYSPHLLSPLVSLATLDGSPYIRPAAPGAPYRRDRNVRLGQHRSELGRAQ